MRSAIVTAAFAAGALAVPLVERAIVYETEVVYATQYVTVTAPAEAAVATEAPAAYTDAVVPSSSSKKHHFGHGNRKPHYGWTSSWATTWTESAPVQSAPAYEAPAPAPTSAVQEQAPAYSSEEPAPAPTSYEAPAYSSEEPAPTSYEAPSSSEAPAPSSSASSGGKVSGYQDIVVHHHNIHRANHSAPDLTWSDSLAATAQKIGESCSYAHDTEMDGGGYGQNIAAGVKADNVSAVITELFYNAEIDLYGNQYNQKVVDMTNFHEWGHFTQIVWGNTTEVGCATVDCSSTGLANTGDLVSPYFTVCNYKQAGNMQNDWEFAWNVKEPRGHATCSWNDGL